MQFSIFPRLDFLHRQPFESRDCRQEVVLGFLLAERFALRVVRPVTVRIVHEVGALVRAVLVLVLVVVMLRLAVGMRVGFSFDT